LNCFELIKEYERVREEKIAKDAAAAGTKEKDVSISKMIKYWINELSIYPIPYVVVLSLPDLNLYAPDKRITSKFNN
jgi:hypothetical protein